jgi:hypothetical protein
LFNGGAFTKIWKQLLANLKKNYFINFNFPYISIYRTSMVSWSDEKVFVQLHYVEKEMGLYAKFNFFT